MRHRQGGQEPCAFGWYVSALHGTPNDAVELGQASVPERLRPA